MGVSAGPDLKEDGLVLALDAGNLKGFDDDENYILNSTNLYNSCFETNGSGSDGDGTYVTYQDGGNKGYLGSIAPTGETSVRLKTPANYGGYSKQRTFFNINFPSSTECTASIFYKNDPTNPIPSIQFWGQNTSGPNQGSVVTVSLTGSPGVSYGNGWYRLTVNLGTSPSTNNFNFFSLLLDSNYSNNRYCEFAGFQIEKGSSASPYYPTTSTAKIRGTTLIDLTGRGNTGTLTNGPTYSSANGGSLVFDGADDYILGTIPSSTFNGAHSIGCWFYRKTLTQWSGLFSTNVGTTSCPILTFIDTTNIIGTNQAGINGAYVGIDLGADHLNKWIYCVMTVSGSTNGSTVNVYAYKNGSLLTATGSLYWTLSSSSSYYVGRHWQGGAQIHNGNIAQVQIYNRALTAQEIQQNYNALRGRFKPEYEALTYTASGNLTVTGNGSASVNIFKTSGSNAWDNQAYSLVPFTAPCTIEFDKQAASGDNGVSYAMIGWNTDPLTNASYDSIDYASYPFITSNYQVYHNGTLVQNGGTWSTANKLYVVYGTDGFIRHYNGSTLLYSVNYGIGNTVYVDSSFYSPNATFGGFSNIKVIRSAWNGFSYV